MTGIAELEKIYYRDEIPKVRKAIAEFKEEMGAWGKEQRLSCLEDELKVIQKEIKRI